MGPAKLAIDILNEVANEVATGKKKPGIGFEEAELRAALRALAVKHPVWVGGKPSGNCAPNQRGGYGADAKRVRRLWRGAEGLTYMPKERRKRRTWPGDGEAY